MKKAALKRGWTTVVVVFIIIDFCVLLSWQEKSSSATAFMIIISQRKKYQQQQLLLLQHQKRHKSLVPSSTTSNIFFFSPTGTTTTILFNTRLLSKAKKDDGSNDDNDDDDSSSTCDEEEDRFASNARQNRRWLIDEFQYTWKRKEKKHDFLTLENSVLKERAEWLQEELDLTKKEMNKIINMHPHILSLRTDTNVQPTLKCLVTALKLDKIDLKKLVLTNSVIIYSRKEDIEPKLEYLQNRLEMDDAMLKELIQKSPNILTKSMNATIGRIDYLHQRLNLTNDTQQVSKIIRQFPGLLLYSIDSLESRLTWLQNRLCVSDTRLTEIIRIQPDLLGRSIPDNLEPTLEFYIQAAKETTSEEDVITLIAKNPIYLAFGLDKRLKPRLKQLQEENYTIDIAALRAVAMLTKEEWKNKHYEKRLK